MIINEMGNPVGFEFKKILHEGQQMKSEFYPNNIFFFNKKFDGECICRIDKESENFFISVLILDYLMSKLIISPKDAREGLDDTIKQEYGNFELAAMADWEIDHYDDEFKNYKFIEI